MGNISFCYVVFTRNDTTWLTLTNNNKQHQTGANFLHGRMLGPAGRDAGACDLVYNDGVQDSIDHNDNTKWKKETKVQSFIAYPTTGKSNQRLSIFYIEDNPETKANTACPNTVNREESITYCI